ncbi:Alpha/beta hydrolase family-domain-containing protein [Kalaharituber pfeilii]|nr:Alpha/beta hydrolase family-domain-containing protein [Kalaharituber pfeilii]
MAGWDTRLAVGGAHLRAYSSCVPVPVAIPDSSFKPYSANSGVCVFDIHALAAMSVPRWDVKTHTIPAAFPREYIRATRHPDTQLRIVLNQYTPVDQTPVPGDVTLIIAHANGFQKELYEPMFDELLISSKDYGFRIRAVWALDAAHQGASSIVNEKDLGDNPCWNDYSRDIEQMINTFASYMPAPRIGIGHSIGGQAIFECAIRNPGLFTAIVGIDPLIHAANKQVLDPGEKPAVASARRRDIWPSREEAEKFFRSRSFYNAWDPRVLELQLKYGLRPLPTAIYPVPPNSKSAVTLTTTKHQEVMTFLQLDPNSDTLYRAEPARTFDALPAIKVSILYIFGGKSGLSNAEARQGKKQQNPDAEMITIERAGHLIPQEAPAETAKCLAPFLAKHIRKWEKQAEKASSLAVGQTITQEFMQRLSKL